MTTIGLAYVLVDYTQDLLFTAGSSPLIRMRETVDIFPCWMLIDERSSWTQLWQHLTTELGFISFRFLYSLIEFFHRPICIAKIRPTINHYTYVSKYKYQIYGAKFLSSNVCVYIKVYVWVSKKNRPPHASYFYVGHKSNVMWHQEIYCS